MNTSPLSGIRVVEMASYVAAPSCAKILADMGADVIKVEMKDGDPWRTVGRDCTKRGDAENPLYEVYNAGKQSICIDIKAPGGIGCLLKLLENADIFVTNMRPKSLKKAGLDGDTLLARFPKLVHATITGYGTKGPSANDPGFDGIAYWARSGFLRDMSISTEDSYPILAPTAMGDTITGMALYGAVTTALYSRELTGKGDCVSTSLYANAIWTMCSMIIRGEEKYGERFPKLCHEDSPVTCPYKCADGEWFAITILEYDRYAPLFYELLGIKGMIIDEMGINSMNDALDRRHEIIPIIESAFMKKTAAEWQSILAKEDITCCILKHFKDVEQDEQAWVNGYLHQVSMRNGETMAMPRSPIHFASCGQKSFEVASMPGDDTVDVLTSAGLNMGEINSLRETGVIG